VIADLQNMLLLIDSGNNSGNFDRENDRKTILSVYKNIIRSKNKLNDRIFGRKQKTY